LNWLEKLCFVHGLYDEKFLHPTPMDPRDQARRANHGSPTTVIASWDRWIRHRPALDESLRLDVGSMTPFLSDFLPSLGALATKQSIFLVASRKLDCFAALAMTADYAFGTNPPHGLIQHRHYATRKEAKRTHPTRFTEISQSSSADYFASTRCNACCSATRKIYRRHVSMPAFRPPSWRSKGRHGRA